MTEADRSTSTQAVTNSDCEILAFCCNFCAYAAADLAGARRMQYPANVWIVHVPCTGKVEVEHLLAAFERGIDGVLVAGCLEGGCHFIDGNLYAKKRVKAIRILLDECGLEPARLRMINISAAMAVNLVEIIRDLVKEIKELGPKMVNTRLKVFYKSDIKIRFYWI